MKYLTTLVALAGLCMTATASGQDSSRQPVRGDGALAPAPAPAVPGKLRLLTHDLSLIHI